MEKTTLLEQAEKLSSLMMDKLRDMMVEEVSEYSFEMGTDLANGRSAFSLKIKEFSKHLMAMSEIVVFLDESPKVNRGALWEVEQLANNAKENPDDGFKIKAIKALRNLIPGTTLKDAKYAVEEYMGSGVWVHQVLNATRGM